MNIHCKYNENLSGLCTTAVECTANNAREYHCTTDPRLGLHNFTYLGWNDIYQFRFIVQSNSALRTFSVRANLVLKLKNVLILSVIYYINHQLVIGNLVLKVKQVLILTVLKAKFDCTLWTFKVKI